MINTILWIIQKNDIIYCIWYTKTDHRVVWYNYRFSTYIILLYYRVRLVKILIYFPRMQWWARTPPYFWHISSHRRIGPLHRPRGQLYYTFARFVYSSERPSLTRRRILPFFLNIFYYVSLIMLCHSTYNITSFICDTFRYFEWPSPVPTFQHLTDRCRYSRKP